MMERLHTLKKRADYLRLRSAPTWNCKAFLMAGAPRAPTTTREPIYAGGSPSSAKTGMNRAGATPAGPTTTSNALSKSVVRSKAEAPECAPRFGFTVTKKLGNAVIRNRIKRRLKEAVRLALGARPTNVPCNGAPTGNGPRSLDKASDFVSDSGWDFVIVARRKALDIDHAELTTCIHSALDALYAGQGQEKGSTARGGARQRGRKHPGRAQRRGGAGPAQGGPTT